MKIAGTIVTAIILIAAGLIGLNAGGEGGVTEPTVAQATPTPGPVISDAEYSEFESHDRQRQLEQLTGTEVAR